MAGFQGDVKSRFFEDTNATSNTFVAAAAQPTTTFTLAKTSFGTNTGRKITATTSGSGDSGKTITIVGTDVNGDALTEVITLPGSATTTSGTTNFFLTLTSATVSAQPAANVSLGMTDDVAGGIFAGRTRVRQMQVSSGGAAGNVEVRNGSTSGATGITVRTTATADDNTTINIPQDGVLYKDGAFVTFNESECSAVTAYFDG
jgi:hypothetical protein